MADEDQKDEDRSDDEEDSQSVETKEGTKPGDWERQPADKEDLRHDDGSEPLASPKDDDEDDLAEQEAGDVTASDDEGFDRPETPDEAGVGEAGGALERHAEPLLQGSSLKTPVGAVPALSIVGIVAFIVVFCLAFFGLWALLGGFGLFLGILVGTALGFGAMKLLADRAR